MGRKVAECRTANSTRRNSVKLKMNWPGGFRAGDRVIWREYRAHVIALSEDFGVRPGEVPIEFDEGQHGLIVPADDLNRYPSTEVWSG